MNVQHDCYSSKCTGTRHIAVWQEREKTSRTQARVDHKPDARFVLNVYSIHNYETILAVTPPDLLAPLTSVDSDIVTLRRTAAQHIRGEETVSHSLGTGGDALPFDRTHAKSRSAPQPDTNTIFIGTLSSQSKSTLMEMAAVLSISNTEKARKQELVVKIREHLDAKPEVRNGTQFVQVTWRSGRNKAACAVSTPSSTLASTSSLHTLQEPLLYFPPPTASAPYLFPQIPSASGPQHNDLHGHVQPDIRPYPHTYHLPPVPVTHQGYYPGAPYNFYRATD